MLSLAKATGEEQIRTFCERFRGQVFRVSEKLDGLSLSVVYVDGNPRLRRHARHRRGRRAVTEKVRQVIPGLPDEIDEPTAAWRCAARRVMLRSIWSAYNDDAPRQARSPTRAAAPPGTLMQKDPEAAADAGRLLRFFAFGADRDGAAVAAPSLGAFEDGRHDACATTSTR